MLYPIVAFALAALILAFVLNTPDMPVEEVKYVKPRPIPSVSHTSSPTVTVVQPRNRNTPVTSQLSLGGPQTKASDMTDVIDVDFVPTYDDVLAEVRKTSASSDVSDDDVVTAYKKVRDTASKSRSHLTVEKLVNAAKHAAQFPAGYFSQVVDYKLPQVTTRGRHNESQQPLANFARVFRLPSEDERNAVKNDQFWRDALLRSFGQATDAELLSVLSVWQPVSETSGCFGYIGILNIVLDLRNDAND